MTKTLRLALAASTLALGVAAPASAGPVYVIDDFISMPPNPFSATLNTQGQSAQDGPENYVIGGITYNRKLVFENVADNNAFAGAQLIVANGDLKIVNGAGVRSRLTMTYNIGMLDMLIPDAASMQLGISFSNGLNTVNGPTTINAYIGDGAALGTSLGQLILTQRIDGTTPELWSNMTLLGSQISQTNKYLTFVINGPADYDLTLDQIQAEITNAASDAVPEPGMLGLFGAGILGLGLARRRKR